MTNKKRNLNMHDNLRNFSTFAVQIAKEAGSILKNGFGSTFSIQSKDGRHDLVTEYDQKVEHFLKEKIKIVYPEHEILAEESASGQFYTEKPCWIIDPLDGTVNFARSIPFFSISIALCIKNQIELGVVLNVMHDELFVAVRGHGAYLNGKKIESSKTQHLKEAILATGFPYDLIYNPNHCIEHFIEILRLGVPIRRMGSAAIDLCYVAAGRFDGFWEISLKPWDFCAGALIVEEAKGMTGTINQHPLQPFITSSVVATNGHLYASLLKQLQLK